MNQPEPIPERQVRLLLGPDPCALIDRLGLQPAAVRCILPRPSGTPGGRPAPARAVVCRLYPKTTLARAMFNRAGLLRNDACAEAIVFPDPGDDLEQTLLEGMHNATILARTVLEPNDTATPSHQL